MTKTKTPKPVKRMTFRKIGNWPNSIVWNNSNSDFICNKALRRVIQIPTQAKRLYCSVFTEPPVMPLDHVLKIQVSVYPCVQVFRTHYRISSIIWAELNALQELSQGPLWVAFEWS